MDDNAGAPPTAPASVNTPPLIEFGDFMSLPGAPVPEATGSVASAPRVSAGNAARLPTETPAAPTFVEAGAGRAPMPLRTPAEVVEAAARVSRLIGHPSIEATCSKCHVSLTWSAPPQ